MVATDLQALRPAGKIMRLTGAGWSSLAARRAHNPKVVGSNPTPATNLTMSEHGPDSGAFCFPGFAGGSPSGPTSNLFVGLSIRGPRVLERPAAAAETGLSIGCFRRKHYSRRETTPNLG